MNTSIWNKLNDLCQHAEHQIVIAAPYIKTNILSELLQKIPDNVKIQCVTRWQAAEIALGVNDIEAYDIVQKKGGQFFCNPTLHAKYYRVDENCLIGSANLTAKALGKSPQPNLELLESYACEKLKEFEAQMLAASILVEDGFKAAMVNEVMKWKESNPDINLISDKEDNNTFPLTCWLPELGMLHPFYIRAGDKSDFSEAWITAAEHDLNVLQIPPDLSRPSFKQSVATALQCFLIVNIIKELSGKEGISEEQGKKLLEDNFGSLPNNAWNILCKWLIEYLNYVLIDGKLCQRFS